MDTYIKEDTLDEMIDEDLSSLSRKRLLLYSLKYETADGIHTYHKCKCGNTTRAGKCFDCLVKEYANGKTT